MLGLQFYYLEVADKRALFTVTEKSNNQSLATGVIIAASDILSHHVERDTKGTNSSLFRIFFENAQIL